MRENRTVGCSNRIVNAMEVESLLSEPKSKLANASTARGERMDGESIFIFFMESTTRCRLLWIWEVEPALDVASGLEVRCNRSVVGFDIWQYTFLFEIRPKIHDLPPCVRLACRFEVNKTMLHQVWSFFDKISSPSFRYMHTICVSPKFSGAIVLLLVVKRKLR